MASMSAIRDGFGTNLAALSSATNAWNVYTRLTSNMSTPYVCIGGASIKYDETFAATVDKRSHLYEWVILAAVAPNLDTDALNYLELAQDPTSTLSIPYLVESDITLGGTVQYARVKDVTDPHVYQYGGTPAVVGVEFTVEVRT